MNTRQSQLTLLGLAFGILLALLIAPQTRWLVRAQLFPSIMLPRHYEQQKQAFVQSHPNDYQVQLAGKTSAFGQTAVDYDRRLVPRFPDSASLRANILRYATISEVDLYRDEGYLMAGQSDAAHLTAFDADAAAGEQLDPDNAYFPFMRAYGLFAARRDAEGLAAIQRASQEHLWRDYSGDEVEGGWRINRAIYGGQEAISAAAISASVEFPHYQKLRAVARIAVAKAILDEQAGHPEAGLAKREALARCGEIMVTQSTSLIGNLVGIAINAISRGRPGGAPPHTVGVGLSNEQRQQAGLDTYCAYVTIMGHPEAAVEARADYQNSQQIRRITSHIDNFYFGIGLAKFTLLIDALVAGWAVFPITFVLLALGAIAAGLIRLPRIQSRRPLPAGAASGFWSVTLAALICGVVFINVAPSDFPACAALVVFLTLVFAALAALLRPHLRRPILTALLTAGVTLGVFGLYAIFISWQMRGAIELGFTLRQTLGLSGEDANGGAFDADKAAGLQTALGLAAGLAIPLLTAIILSIVSRIKRVPVSAGLVFGFRAVMPPLVLVLMLVYGGLTLWTVQQEARANYGLERSSHGEGQYLAQTAGLTWPQMPAQ